MHLSLSIAFISKHRHSELVKVNISVKQMGAMTPGKNKALFNVAKDKRETIDMGYYMCG